jgi:hypothetical protein
MSRIALPVSGIVGKGRSLNENSGYMQNCYLEQSAAGNAVLIGTPGMILKATLPNAPIRGCYSDSAVSYWVAGNGVYKVNPDFTYLLLGSLNTFNGHVDFASSGIDLMIADGTDGWAIKLATNVLTRITDPDFPTNPVAVQYLNGYFIVSQKDTQIFYVSEKSNIATSWNALDFASAEGKPDKTAGLAVYQGELVILGYKSIEFWNFTGNVDFPLQRNNSAVIDHGIIAPYSTSRALDSIYWLGGDNLGQGLVWRLNGYTPERISTHEIEQQIAALPYIGDAYSLTYQQEGHIFYVLQFPSANKTLAYDTVTGLWHTRSYRNPLSGVDDSWRASAICFSGSILAGDTQTGNIYKLSLDEYTDNGNIIMRVRDTTEAAETQKYLYYNELIVNMEVGVGLVLGQGNDPQLMVQWSNDYGHTWGNFHYASIGKIGQYGARAKFNRLGRGRNRVWRLTMSDPVKFVVLGATLEVETGTS